MGRGVSEPPIGNVDLGAVFAVGEGIEVLKPKPLGAIRKNLSDQTWARLTSDIENRIIRRANAYNPPPGEKGNASFELAELVTELSDIFAELPRNTPVSRRNAVETTYAQILRIVTGRKIDVVEKPGAGKSRQRKLPGTN